jgi:hypothetical protein
VFWIYQNDIEPIKQYNKRKCQITGCPVLKNLDRQELFLYGYVAKFFSYMQGLKSQDFARKS